MKARKVLFNGECEEIDFVKKDYDDRFVIEIDRNFEFENVKYIDVMYDEYYAKSGDDGYFVLPQSRSDEDGMLVYFNEKENMIFESGRSLSAFMYGVKKETESFLAIITLNCLTYTYVVEVKDNKYYIYPRFIVNGDEPYDNFEVTFFKMTKGKDSYSDMAVKYRSYMIEKGFLTPIEERMNENLKYACESIYVRIRQGWKPVPSVIEEQTIENEPNMHVACTFAQVEEIMQSYKNKKIDKAEFCLVGWNVKGHDGRWPSALPAEESLGGEKGLKKLIKKAKELGYTISCHTNSTDAYTISEYYCDDDIKVGKNQQILKHENMWSGGRARWVCPSKYLEIAKKISGILS